MGRTKILCADCGHNLTRVTGNREDESASCPFCGHQKFSRWSFDGYLGPDADTASDEGGESE